MSQNENKHNISNSGIKITSSEIGSNQDNKSPQLDFWNFEALRDPSKLKIKK